MFTVVIFEYPLNGLRLPTPSEKVQFVALKFTVTRLVQFSKASYAIVVTELPMVMEARLVQFLKA